jgi:hypothetical protein
VFEAIGFNKPRTVHTSSDRQLFAMRQIFVRAGVHPCGLFIALHR